MSTIYTSDSLKTVLSECGTSLSNAARTIRELIVQRNDALASTTPAAVADAVEERTFQAGLAGFEAALEIARQDLEAAISEAAAAPSPTPKKAAPQPAPPTPPIPLDPMAV